MCKKRGREGRKCGCGWVRVRVRVWVWLWLWLWLWLWVWLWVWLWEGEGHQLIFQQKTAESVVAHMDEGAVEG
jgi:hypothetical protein